MTRRPVKVVHSRANSAMVWLLPAPAGATSTVVAVVAVSIIITASRCSAFRSGALGGGPGLLLADELRHGPFGGGEDLFFGVEVGQGAVPFLVRRPVDAAAVGGADAEAGHVGDVRGGDLDDLGPGPAADGQPGHLVDHRLAVGARLAGPGAPGAPRTGAGPSTRPHGGFAPRPPRSARRCAWPHHPAPPVRGRRARRRTRRPARAPPTAACSFAVRGLGFPGGEPLRRGGFGRAGLPGDGAAGLALGAAGVLPGLLVQQPQRPPRRRLAVHRLVLAGQPVQFAGDRDGAGAEQVHHVLADPADLGAVAVRPGHHGVARARTAWSPGSGRRPGRRRAAGCAGCGSPGSATCRRRRRRAGPGSRSPRARAAAGRRRGTGGAGTSWRPGRRRRATPPCGRNGGRCGCRWRAAPARRRLRARSPSARPRSHRPARRARRPGPGRRARGPGGRRPGRRRAAPRRS